MVDNPWKSFAKSSGQKYHPIPNIEILSKLLEKNLTSWYSLAGVMWDTPPKVDKTTLKLLFDYFVPGTGYVPGFLFHVDRDEKILVIEECIRREKTHPLRAIIDTRLHREYLKGEWSRVCGALNYNLPEIKVENCFDWELQ